MITMLIVLLLYLLLRWDNMEVKWVITRVGGSIKLCSQINGFGLEKCMDCELSKFTDFENMADRRLAENFGQDSRLFISGGLDRGD